ncbi:hypothetical protein RIR_jg17701.t2 [Rhizophagus irregularis DAOM 181602=DAOM 197198]|uniref:Uncharacterized protein n=1 Tax=Rhizophagus irregularis (strain DAOM 181602 / DAOM 197198 / MUCL 43194) TaxID=747089 RepID=U9U9J6_RHIID|nr:hypothetical protein RIR_jg17701.t2 [Rhizophagus irregularis DAOM 181602=DAOM 197198]
MVDYQEAGGSFSYRFSVGFGQCPIQKLHSIGQLGKWKFDKEWEEVCGEATSFSGFASGVYNIGQLSYNIIISDIVDITFVEQVNYQAKNINERDSMSQSKLSIF